MSFILLVKSLLSYEDCQALQKEPFRNTCAHGHCNLETESAQRANPVKNSSRYLCQIWVPSAQFMYKILSPPVMCCPRPDLMRKIIITCSVLSPTSHKFGRAEGSLCKFNLIYFRAQISFRIHECLSLWAVYLSHYAADPFERRYIDRFIWNKL